MHNIRDTEESFKIENNQFICLRCDTIIPLQLPMAIPEFTKLMKKLTKEHKNCQKVEK